MPNENTLPTPETRREMFLAAAAGESVEKPEPITREEMFLNAIGGGSGDAYTKAETDALLDGKADIVDGKVPASELPSYVDDTIEGYYYEGAFYEDSEHTTVITGERGKIYIDLTANKSYRWTGTVYVRIDECPAFGETQGTIYEGNKGKQNADAIASIKDGANIDSFADVEAALASKANTADLGTAAAADTTTSITSGGTEVPTSGTVYTDQQRQDAEIGTLVDRVAKNRLSVSSGSATNAYVFDNLAVNMPAGNYVFVADITNYGTRSELVINASDGSRVGGVSFNNASSVAVPFSITGEGVVARLYTMGGTFTNMMLCTAADYAASSAYQPYAPTNRELYEMILAMQSGGTV